MTGRRVGCYAGKDIISFIYYSGHGDSDADTKINYLILIVVVTAVARLHLKIGADALDVASKCPPDAVLLTSRS
jgi:hypothetical protein